ncbi:DUF333 domain-containing protein [Candidatus Beckwithbacteria bacterium]|nr:DUF333 domain-containing protein [Candidatus Beckwithbacteria bacterium]
MKIRFVLIFIIICFLFTACAVEPEAGAIPTVEEVLQKRENVTEHEAEVFCRDKGGKIETWQDGSVYCIMPQGYGCDPIEFYRGICGAFEK